MPLLNIIGVTGANTSLQIAVVFMCAETEENHRWALETLRSMIEANGIALPLICFQDQEIALVNAFENVFPQCPTMLCLWHIFKNVPSYAKLHGMADIKHFENKQVKPIYEGSIESDRHKEFMACVAECVYAKTETELATAKLRLHHISPQICGYVENQYLGVWCHKVASCYWQNTVCFGISTTSRGEGAHHTMKSWLYQRSTFMSSGLACMFFGLSSMTSINIPWHLQQPVFCTTD